MTILISTKILTSQASQAVLHGNECLMHAVNEARLTSRFGDSRELNQLDKEGSGGQYRVPPLQQSWAKRVDEHELPLTTKRRAELLNRSSAQSPEIFAVTSFGRSVHD
jgi:hypothetical protein